jgi:hypothetical protein
MNGTPFLGLGRSMGRELVEINIIVGEFQWLMCMFQARVPLYLLFYGQSTYVSVELGPEFLCNLFRIEFMCDFGLESLYFDYWSGRWNYKMKLCM